MLLLGVTIVCVFCVCELTHTNSTHTLIKYIIQSNKFKILYYEYFDFRWF